MKLRDSVQVAVALAVFHLAGCSGTAGEGSLMRTGASDEPAPGSAGSVPAEAPAPVLAPPIGAPSIDATEPTDPTPAVAGEATTPDSAAVPNDAVVPPPVAGGADDVLIDEVDPETGAGGAPSCGIQDFTREVRPTEVLLVIDRSGSMENEMEDGTRRWDAVVPTVVGAVEATASSILWGVKSYPELDETESCSPESIVPTIHVPLAEGSTALVVAEVETTTPLGDGTPTGDAIGFALDHLEERALVSDSPKYILLATDGEPTCPEDDDDVDPVDFTVSQIAAALEAGFPTFVLGVDTSDDDTVEDLNAMAIAGGKPRTGAESFYLASTEAEISEALSAITGEVASCVFDLEPPPPVPDNIAVDFGDARADHDPTRQNGWEYTKDDYTQLEVYGTWCDRIRTEAMNQVSIKYGCPDQPIPEAR